ncbi:MAG TPA: AmmeMemoRadiSam system protein A, partial [Rubrivivax sp.]|nr:AmmeMemoRadiSam system protein A [Rubrivivax sp.]
SHGLAASLLGVRNSAEAPGMARADRSRVVGYGAVAFDPAPGPEPVSGEDGDDAVVLGRVLVATARRSIADALGLVVPPAEPAADHPALDRPGASFVTLHGADGRLRGCVGHLEAIRPLRDDVHANARSAAFHDSRFEALRADEWPGLSIEISVLDPAEPLAAASEADARAALRPGVDGVILEWRGRRATFLPQVWQQLPDGGDFIAALKRKAGLAADFWSAELRLSRYRVRSFGDAETTGRPS